MQDKKTKWGFFQGVFTAPKAFLRQLRALVRVNVFRLSGIEKHSGNSIVIYFGGIEPDLRFLAHMALESDFNIEPLGRRFVWTVLRQRDDLSADLRITSVHRVWSRWIADSKGFHIPRWVGVEVDLERSRELAENSKRLKWDMRKVTRKGYTYEVTRDRDMYDYFYEHMYLPYISTVFGERSFLMSYEVMMSELESCELGLVMHEGKAVAGGILIYQDGGVRGWSLGVLDGDISLVRDGAITALYYLETLYLIAKGYSVRSFGSSRAFVNDGVLRFKLKWGAKLTSSKPHGFHLGAIRDTPASRAFLENNPFVFEKARGFHAGLFAPDDCSEDFGRWLKQQVKVAGQAGIDRLQVYCSDEQYEIDLKLLNMDGYVELNTYGSVFAR